MAQISIYDLTVPQFTLSLKALKNVLRKAKIHAESKKIEPTVLLQTRLIPDQFALARQIQIATDTAKGCAARLTGGDIPVFEDKEQSFEEFDARIDKTIKFLETIKENQFEGWEKRKITFSFYPGVFIEGRDFLVQHALPNFYFHITTAYAILRASGVDIGKKDYLGEQNWQKV